MKKMLLPAVLSLALSCLAMAQPTNRNMNIIKIWPEGTPQAYDVSDNPMLRAYSEAQLEAFPVPGAEVAVIMCPGGAYMMEAQDHEGRDLAPWFNARGISYYMLQYRLPNGKYTTAPLEDAMEAMRIVRRTSGAKKIGIMGCSAGGHLATTLATHYSSDSRPDFQILLYPVVTMDAAYTHEGSRVALLGQNPTAEQVNLYSNEKQVTSDTPVAFIVGSTNDDAVPVRNFVNYYLALLDHGVSASLHLYPSGGHGWGFRDNFIYKQDWTSELDKWLHEIILK